MTALRPDLDTPPARFGACRPEPLPLLPMSQHVRAPRHHRDLNRHTTILDSWTFFIMLLLVALWILVEFAISICIV